MSRDRTYRRSMPLVLGPVDERRLQRLAQRAENASLSYPEVGATRSTYPPGYRHDHYSVDLGSGPTTFDRACDALRRWVPQRGAGARVLPSGARIAEDQTVVVVLGLPVATLPLVTLVAPCRIVYVTDEPDRFGYAYGTLDGHPERGEESFHVLRTDGATRFEIESFSRPVHPAARVGAPITRCLQVTVTRRYLDALRRDVERAMS